MTNDFNRFFGRGSGARYEGHPSWQTWRARIDGGEKPVLKIYRPRDGIVWRTAQMFLDWGGGQLEKHDWDDALNEGLLQLRVKADTKESEALRVNLGIRPGLKRAAIEVGDGYFNAVLANFLRWSAFSTRPELQAVLADLRREGTPEHGQAYRSCLAMIEGVIGAQFSALEQLLGYERDDVIEIVARGLAGYVDERFHISVRKEIGFA